MDIQTKATDVMRKARAQCGASVQDFMQTNLRKGAAWFESAGRRVWRVGHKVTPRDALTALYDEQGGTVRLVAWCWKLHSTVIYANARGTRMFTLGGWDTVTTKCRIKMVADLDDVRAPISTRRRQPYCGETPIEGDKVYTLLGRSGVCLPMPHSTLTSAIDSILAERGPVI